MLLATKIQLVMLPQLLRSRTQEQLVEQALMERQILPQQMLRLLLM